MVVNVAYHLQVGARVAEQAVLVELVTGLFEVPLVEDGFVG